MISFSNSDVGTTAEERVAACGWPATKSCALGRIAAVEVASARFDPATIASTIRALRVTRVPQRQPARRGDGRCLRVHADVLQDPPDLHPLGDERKDAHVGATQGTHQRKNLVDARD